MIVVGVFSCSPSKISVKFWDRLPSCRSTHWGSPAEEGGSICFLGPLPFTWKRCEVYPGFVYHGPGKDVCVSPAYFLVSVLSSCMCTLFLPQAYFAFSEELSLRRARAGKLGRFVLYTGCLLLTFIAIHEEKNTPNTQKQD